MPILMMDRRRESPDNHDLGIQLHLKAGLTSIRIPKQIQS